MQRHENMINLCDAVEVSSGTPQFRIAESSDAAAPVYTFYSQADLEDDRTAPMARKELKKQIRTFDQVSTVSTGEVVFSLLSGTAAVVQSDHDGYLITQNYAVLAPSKALDARYLVYLLNENPQIKRQMHLGQQGSVTMKYTLRQLYDLKLPDLPSLGKQECIGELYLSQLRLAALKKRSSELETSLVLAAIREADQL